MEPLVIFVCAPQRSGTSCVSGILHYLGIPMGRSWIKANRGNPGGYFEDAALRRISWSAVEETLSPRPRNRRNGVQLLRRWLKRRSSDGPIIGAKYPALSMAIPAVVEAWPNVKFIVPVRDPEASARSMHKCGARSGWRLLNLEAKTERFRQAIAYRDKQLQEFGCDVLRLPFPEFTKDPQGTVKAISEFCGISPSESQVQNAINFINPSFVHF